MAIPLSILFIELDHFEDELTISLDFLTVNSQIYGILQFYMATLPICLLHLALKREKLQ
ncbi:MAG TPA: hypothetical protein VE843_16835 [Ktedonobacteraceae bacterium]|nr:hypothetical protein [Ktedonobacteraceae bacterium]